MMDAAISNPISTGLTFPPAAIPVADVKAELLGALPKLRAYAVSLCGRSERAEDLVQETVLRALGSIDTFEPGTNMKAWLYTILRNLFYSEYRKRRFEVEDEEGLSAAAMESRPEQEGHMYFLNLQDALDRLEPAHREALILVGAAGHSYDQAALLCGCAIGTMKSRVSRARIRLAAMLEMPAGL
jgi:RNA polymerase sigma-70 factor, ECF subfamily